MKIETKMEAKIEIESAHSTTHSAGLPRFRQRAFKPA
jgi:hypothetical protein